MSLNHIRLADILIKENRQRQEFDPEALQELKNSIADRGLFHPPVLRKEGAAWVLVAGERRLKAIAELFELGGEFVCNGETYGAEAGVIPFTNLGELSVLDAEEAELDENLKRRDLTWQEHAAAVARLHQLRTAQKDQKFAAAVQTLVDEGKPVSLGIEAPQTIADTAEEVTGRRDGSYQDQVRKEIIVAKHLDNPAVAKAKSADEAFKILKKQEEAQKNRDLAARIGASFTTDKHLALNVNCLEWMADPANVGTIDVICTDPPYGMGADEFGDAGGKMTGIEHHYDDSLESWKDLMAEWAAKSWMVTKPQAHAYVFCDIDNFHQLKRYMEGAGWYVFRTPLIVHKLNSGRVPLPEHGPRRQYETILYAIKGKKPVTHIYPDVISVNGDENMGHGAQKPVALFQNLLQRSVRPGDKVLDSFAGSGPIIPAGHAYKCEVVALEMNQEYFGMILKRLAEMKQADEITDIV